MFHLWLCSGRTWILSSSGCPASSRALPVQISPSPATLRRRGRGTALSPPRDAGPAAPLGTAPFDRGVGLPLAPLQRVTPSPPTAPIGGRRRRAYLRGCHAYAAAPTRVLGPAPWTPGVTPCPSPWTPVGGRARPRGPQGVG